MDEATTALLPTFSHTWVEPSAVTVGWFAGTRQVWAVGEGPADERQAAWELFAQVRDAAPGESSMLARSTYYRQGFSMDDGSCSVLYDGIGRAAGSVLLSARQALFERLGSEAWALVVALAPGLHVSRLDLAADAEGSSTLRPSALYGLLPAARSRSQRVHQVLTVDRGGGEKLTLGSRSSERYLRVYVKDQRVRHELELKQGAARAAMGRLLTGASLAGVWAQEYVRVVEWR